MQNDKKISARTLLNLTLPLDPAPSLRTDVAIQDALLNAGHRVSRGQIKRWLKEGKIQLEPGYAELVNINVAPPVAQASKCGSFLPVVYEDADLLILYKAAGIPTAPHDAEETETAVGSALAHGLDARVGRNALEPGLVHRLDTDTSGLLVFAKTQEEYENLCTTWKAREVVKIYRALVPSFPPTPFKIEYPLAHHPKSSKKMIALTGTQHRHTLYRGKPIPAVTEVLAKTEGKGRVDLTIQLHTGVMHQIRCHLAALGCPILGDPVYSKYTGTSRMWLHAWKLKLVRRDGTSLEVEAPLPSDWHNPSVSI